MNRITDTYTHFLINILVNSIIGIYSFKSKKLTKNACIVAFLIGLISIQADLGLFLLLISFFFSSSFLTKLGNSDKEKTISTHNKEKVRSVKQVLCNGLVPALIALTILIIKNIPSKCENNCNESDEYNSKKIICLFKSNFSIENLYIFYFSYIASCNGDTWASEVGVLSSNNPVLITNFKMVPKGTNGGISFLGSVLACLGGIFIGLVCGITQNLFCEVGRFYMSIIIGLFSGFFGSAIDSLLGASLQLTIYDKGKKMIVNEKYVKSNDIKEKDFLYNGSDILSNDTVNFVSATFTSIVTVLLYIRFLR